MAGGVAWETWGLDFRLEWIYFPVLTSICSVSVMQKETWIYHTSLPELLVWWLCVSKNNLFALNIWKNWILHLVVVVLSSVMSFPAEGVESAIKNNIEDVRLCLDSKHPGHYAVYNLSPRTYRPSRFHNRVCTVIVFFCKRPFNTMSWLYLQFFIVKYVKVGHIIKRWQKNLSINMRWRIYLLVFAFSPNLTD